MFMTEMELQAYAEAKDCHMVSCFDLAAHCVENFLQLRAGMHRLQVLVQQGEQERAELTAMVHQGERERVADRALIIQLTKQMRELDRRMPIGCRHHP